MALMAGGFKVAFAAVLATLITLYAPLISLNAYVSTLSEIVYVGSGYKVIYKSPLIPILSGNETKVVLNVKRNGEPIEFGYTLSGITSDGARDVARGGGHGRAVADITGYVDDVVRILREANSNSDRSGLGLLAFIVSKVEENGEGYIATDIISIPVIPGKARGKSIIVEVEFKPIHRIKVNKISKGEQTSRVEIVQTTPPGYIEDYCIYGEYIVCYYWKLNTTYIDPKRYGPRGIPIITAFIDSTDGDYIQNVHLLSFIALKKESSKSMSLDLSLTFKKISLYVSPGPGYYIETTSSEEILFDFSCTIFNSKLSPEPPVSACRYMGAGFEISNFYDEALLAIGFWGYLWLVEYDYRIYDSFSSDVLLDKSLAVYLVPYFTYDGKMYSWQEVDDDPYDGYGHIEGVFKILLNSGHTVFVKLTSKTTIAWAITAYEITKHSSSPGEFGVALPVGAVALLILRLAGITLSDWATAAVAALTVKQGIHGFYSALVRAEFGANQTVTFNPRYLQIDKSYVIYEAGRKEFKIPLIIVWPYVT